MAKDHYVTKAKRRPRSGKRQDTARIARTMAKLRESERLEAEIATLSAMTDDQIDTSDIPEVTDWSGAVVGKFYRK